MNWITKTVLGALIPALLVVMGWGALYAGDRRWVPQSDARIAELNRLEEQISDLQWQLNQNPTNGRIQAKLEQKQRSLKRLQGK